MIKTIHLVEPLILLFYQIEFTECLLFLGASATARLHNRQARKLQQGPSGQGHDSWGQAGQTGEHGEGGGVWAYFNNTLFQMGNIDEKVEHIFKVLVVLSKQENSGRQPTV